MLPQQSPPAPQHQPEPRFEEPARLPPPKVEDATTQKVQDRETRKVRLEVKDISWRFKSEPHDSGRFDVRKAVTDLLKGSMVQVVGDDATTTDATVLVEFTETEGDRYTPGGIGSNIWYQVTVFSAKDLDELFRASTSVSTPSSVRMSIVGGGPNLYTATIDRLREDPVFASTGVLIAASLELHDAQSDLLRRAVNPRLRPWSIAILERSSFAPSSTPERVYWSLLHDDWQALAAIGADASAALLDALPVTQDPEKVSHIASILGKIGERRASAPLCGALHRLVPHSHSLLSEKDLVAAVQVLGALGKIGDAFALKTINEVKDHDHAEVAASARKAIEALRERYGAKDARPTTPSEDR